MRNDHDLHCNDRHPRSCVERLEDRRLLSGNVTVAYDAGSNTVTITGDNKSNELVLSGSLTAGTYTLRGADGTRVNGRSSITVPAVGPNGANFRISLGNGDDVLRAGSVSPAFVPFTANAVSVETGNGDDVVEFANASIRGGLRVSTGNGDDRVAIDFSDVFNGLSISTGNGDDTVAVGNTQGEGVKVFSGGATIDGGRGTDALTGRSALHVLAGPRRLAGIEST